MELDASEDWYLAARIWGDRRNRERMGSAAGTQNKVPPRFFDHVTSEETVADGVTEGGHSAALRVKSLLEAGAE